MTVHLVGGGCAGPLWITLEAKALLKGAEALVYDNLVHPDLLQLAPAGCEFHSVGKRKGRAKMTQGEINDLLVRLGREKSPVVRLKGGDPFVFGRGGEEAQALEEASVPWTYSPGITAAIGGLGRMGIPGTHRGAADSLTLVTGHREGDGRPGEASWKALAAAGGTLAVYMGASSWGELAALLQREGMAPDTACTAVTRGGWGWGQLSRFALRESPAVLQSPAVVAAGGAAGLALSPRRGPLAGVRAAVVRPFPDSWETARHIDGLGGDGFSVPLLAMEELPYPGEEELLARADWVVVTSPRGAAMLSRRADLRRIRGRIASIGPGTTAALARTGLRADGEAHPSTSEALASLLRGAVRPGELAVFFRNEAGSLLPERAVASAGGEALNIPAYRMVPSLPPGWESYLDLWDEIGLDAVVFGSAALAEAWAALAISWPGEATLVAWGEVCARRVEKLFGRKAAVLPAPDLESLGRVLATLKK